MSISEHHFAWEENFPPVYGHTSVSFLKSSPGFENAKRGDLQAAIQVVNRCVKPQRITELKQKYPHAMLIPINTDNKLPVALAQKIGLPIYAAVASFNMKSRKNLTAMERLLHKPDFDGNIIKGQRFIIVDDIVTQGGTIAALRQFILRRGGTVVAVAALAYATGSRFLSPAYQDLDNLAHKFTMEQITITLNQFDIARDSRELTRSQARYLLRFKDMKTMTDKIIHVKRHL